MRKTIILVSSPTPGCGKDLLGSFFVNNHGFTRLAFATKLKKIATDHFYWNGIKDEAGRRLLINLGSIAGRGYKENIWTQSLIDEIVRFQLPLIIITDCRFINEYWDLKNSKELSEYNILSVGIERFVFENDIYKEDISQIDYKHIPKDYIIDNNLDKEYLERWVRRIVEENS